MVTYVVNGHGQCGHRGTLAVLQLGCMHAEGQSHADTKVARDHEIMHRQHGNYTSPPHTTCNLTWLRPTYGNASAGTVAFISIWPLVLAVGVASCRCCCSCCGCCGEGFVAGTAGLNFASVVLADAVGAAWSSSATGRGAKPVYGFHVSVSGSGSLGATGPSSSAHRQGALSPAFGKNTG